MLHPIPLRTFARISLGRLCVVLLLFNALRYENLATAEVRQTLRSHTPGRAVALRNRSSSAPSGASLAASLSGQITAAVLCIMQVEDLLV
eukprot:1768912-Pyramimonas_sp.AAC.1